MERSGSRRGSLEEATKPLEASRSLAAALVERKPNDLERLYELGQSEFWVGYVHWRRRRLDEALARFKAYVDISEKLVTAEPKNSDYQLELSSANSNIASVLQERGDLAGALERFRRRSASTGRCSKRRLTTTRCAGPSRPPTTASVSC